MMQLNFNPFPVLTTERLVLRRMIAADAQEMLFLRSDPGVLKYIDRAPARTIDEVITFIELIDKGIDANDAINWAIALKDNPTLIGNICIWNVQKDNYRAELGYVLHPDWQGRGIMHEAMQAVLHYAFHTMTLHSIEANVIPENSASVRVLERSGFVREAYFRENHFSGGQFRDAAVYSLLTPLR
jgi:[ribosomal protein S5]-alanine N-acetyltransferase